MLSLLRHHRLLGHNLIRRTQPFQRSHVEESRVRYEVCCRVESHSESRFVVHVDLSVDWDGLVEEEVTEAWAERFSISAVGLWRSKEVNR